MCKCKFQVQVRMVREQILGMYEYTFTTADEEKGKGRESLRNYRTTSVFGRD